MDLIQMTRYIFQNGHQIKGIFIPNKRSLLKLKAPRN
jgi:hypothetical protein